MDRNQYNLEVCLVLARLIGHHWRLLSGLAASEKSLEQAQAAAQKGTAAQAVGHLVAAYNGIDRLRRERGKVLRELAVVFEKSRYPRGQSVGGRHFVDTNNDTKDYWAQRRTDLSYMTAPEESIGLDQWQNDLRKLTESYAKQHHVPVRGLDEDRLEE